MELTAAELWRAIGAAQAFTMRGAPGFEARLTPTGWLIATGEPVADFNILMVDYGPDPEGQLRAFGEVLRQRELPALVVLGEAVTDRLKGPATDLGLQAAGHIPLMVHRLADVGSGVPESNRYRVAVVTDAAALALANQLSVAAFGLPSASVDRVVTPAMLTTPGLTFFLAWDGAQPVSTVMTMRVGSTVGIWSMATSPDRQRQGAGRAVLHHALAHHQAQGPALFYLLATEAGKPLYEATGFRTLAEPAVWLRGHSAQVASWERLEADRSR